MKPLIVILLLFSLIGPVAAQNEPLSIEGLQLRNARLLVAGMAFGIGSYDDELALSGQTQLFCAPDDVDISGNYLWDLAEEELDGNQDLATVATIVLQRLQTLYPCAP